MKMLKKTLALLLAATIAMCISGTFAFAEIATELTAFPSAPDTADGTDFSGYYAYMQADTSVWSTESTYYALSDESLTAEAQSASWSKPRAFHKGIYDSDGSAGGNVMADRIFDSSTAGDTWFTLRPDTSSKTYSNVVDPTTQNGKYSVNGFRVALEGETENTLTSVTEGKLMVHTDRIYVKKPTESGTYHSFGLATMSGTNVTAAGTVNAWAIVGMSDTDSGLSLRVKNYDDATDDTYEFDNKFDLSDFVQPGETFDMTLLVDVTAQSYDVYINNRPVAMGLTFKGEQVSEIAACIRGYSEAMKDENNKSYRVASTAFGTTVCYAISDEDAAQYKQAAMETAFAREFAEDKDAVLFYTLGDDAQYAKLMADDDAYRSFKCAGTEGFAITETEFLANENNLYKKVYYTADASYSYDNLEYVYVSAPEKEDATAKVTGTYELIGGKGITNKPVVIQALYEDTDKTELKELAVQEATAAYGTYGGEEFNPEAELDTAYASAFIWGGISKLVPLFDRVNFE